MPASRRGGGAPHLHATKKPRLPRWTSGAGVVTVGCFPRAVRNPFVNIIAGVQIQRDTAQTAVLDISAANYNVTHAGSLSFRNARREA